MSARLLFLPKLLPRADIIGGPILIYHRIKNLSAKGHRITLIAPAYDEKDINDRSLDFCERVIKIRSMKERPLHEIEELHKKLRRPRAFFRGDGAYDERLENAFVSVVREEHFDAVIAEYSMMGQYIEANSDVIPKDTLKVISVHECYTRALELRARKGEKISDHEIKEMRDYEFKMYSTADIVLTLTKEDADILVEYDESLRDKIRIVPHGVDTSFYRPPKNKRETKNILYVGNFLHYPNVDAVKNFINKCLDRILSEVPDAKFYAVGFSPPEELLKMCDEHVVIREGGSNENVRRFYWESDVFVAPIELGTGFRGKILEAMACALPVVATSLATYGLNPIHGKHMFIADNYDKFAEYVIMLLKDASLRREIGTNALALARKFDHRFASETLERVLLEELRKHGA